MTTETVVPVQDVKVVSVESLAYQELPKSISQAYDFDFRTFISATKIVAIDTEGQEKEKIIIFYLGFENFRSGFTAVWKKYNEEWIDESTKCNFLF